MLRAALCWILACSTLPAVAAPAPSVEKVLQYYHTSEFLDQAMKRFEDSLSKRKKEVTVTAQQEAEVLGYARKIYKGRNLYSVFRLAYTKAIRAEDLAGIDTWQQTQPGIMLRQGLDEYYKLPPNERRGGTIKANRRNALSTLATAAESRKINATFALGGDFGVFLALAVYQPKDARDTFRFLKDKIKHRRTGHNEQAYNDALDYWEAVLKSIKNEDVDEIARFYSSVAGQAHATAYDKAVEMAMQQAASTLQAQLLKKSGG